MTAPRATYRLQLQPEFGFDAATRYLDYFSRLGVSHLYLSPIMQAAPGSTHGYDVVDHMQVSKELGGESGFLAFAKAARSANLRLILDIVPNHMAIPGRQNKLWWEVLKHGESSEFACYFDIDWRGSQRYNGQVLLPILGDHYANVLSRGEIRVEKSAFDDLVVRYFDHEFPIDDSTTLSTDDLARLNHNIDELDGLLQKQHYRLAYWKIASDELDYRRFFDINSLIALRMQDQNVFDEAHAKVFEWSNNGVIDGVRVDHVDGLADPIEYLRRLRDGLHKDAYVVVEKILKSDERLPASWPVAGTTGYDTLSYLNGIFIEPSGEAELQRVFVEFTAQSKSFSEICFDAQEFVCDKILRSDIERLAQKFLRISEHHREICDFTRGQFFDVVRALAVCFPVYRSYVVPQSGQRTRADTEYIALAQRDALDRYEDLDADLMQFCVDVLLLDWQGEAETDFVESFQQLTGSVMAKGVEDTAFYRYLRLVSLNEVGCEPDVFAIRADDFHDTCVEVQGLWPNTMVATTTHDTKRSEDVRYRLHTLSMLPDEWGRAVNRWSAMNEHNRRPVATRDPDSKRWPSRSDEYLMYQTMVGAHPLNVERAQAYMQKATNESKIESSWVEPDSGYLDALDSFVESVYSNTAFMEDFEAFVESCRTAGYVTSLAATAVKLMMPGVPDIYQGSELWNETLVDPDNRGLVDFDVRAQLIEDLQTMTMEEILKRVDQGLPKLFVTHKLLSLRLTHPHSFDDSSSYEPMWSTGSCAASVLAFARRDVLTVVPRLVTSFQKDWSDTSITFPEGRWRNVFTGDEANDRLWQLSRVFRDFPVAAFVRCDQGSFDD